MNFTNMPLGRAFKLMATAVLSFMFVFGASVVGLLWLVIG